MGWKPELLARRLALLACTPNVLEALTKRQIQLGHAELLTGVPPEMQDRVLAGLLGAAPGIVWASGVMFVALAPVLVPAAKGTIIRTGWPGQAECCPSPAAQFI